MVKNFFKETENSPAMMIVIFIFTLINIVMSPLSIINAILFVLFLFSLVCEIRKYWRKYK